MQDSKWPFSHYITLHYIRNTHGESHLVYVCALGHTNSWSQMKPSGMDAAGFESEGGSQFDQFDMKDDGSCIQSAPNSVLKQIQLQLASFHDKFDGTFIPPL